MLISRWLKISAGVVVLLALYVNKLPCPIKINEISLTPAEPLEPNTLLRKATLMSHGRMEGPECLAFKDDFIYAGLADGRVIRINTEYNQVETVLFTGNPQRALPFPCGEYNTEHICGRPLGIEFDSRGKLIVADAYFGLLSVNVTTGKHTTLARSVNRAKLVFSNGVAVSKKHKGPVYFTDSGLFERRDVALEVLEGGANGRLVKYSPRGAKLEVVVDKLYFPNGVVLAEDESFVLVAELTKARILKIHLTGSRKTEIWSDGLPLLPDNLSWDLDAAGKRTGGVWVGGSARGLYDTLTQWPNARKLLAKTMKPDVLLSFKKSPGMSLRLNAKGKIIDSPQDSSSRLHSLSGAYPHGDNVFFGSYRKDVKHVAKVPRADLHLGSL